MSRVLRRWAPWVLLVLVLGGALVVGVQRSSHPTEAQRALSIAGRVRCPVCEGQSVAQSNTPASIGIRQLISRDLARGETEGQITRQLTDAYGTQILESPPTTGVTLWVWVIPVVVALGAVIGLVLGFRHWRRAGGPGQGGPGPGGDGAGPAGGRRAGPADEDAVRRALEEAARPQPAGAARQAAGVAPSGVAPSSSEMGAR